MMKLSTKGLLIAGLSATMGIASTSATAAFNDFDVEEGAVGAPTVANDFTADKIIGNYVEIITLNANLTVDVSLKWEAGQFVANDGQDPVGTQLGSFGDEGYDLYALFQASGTYAPDGFGGATFTFGAGGDLKLFIDPDQDTTFNAPVTGDLPWTTNNGGPLDDLLANGETVSGFGELDPTLSTCGPGINCGSFGTETSIALTAFGMAYFTDPDPFYNVAFESGQLDVFTLSGTQEINGSLDVVFAGVPEPSTLALMGLGMMGLGVMRRRKQV